MCQNQIVIADSNGATTSVHDPPRDQIVFEVNVRGPCLWNTLPSSVVLSAGQLVHDAIEAAGFLT